MNINYSLINENNYFPGKYTNQSGYIPKIIIKKIQKHIYFKQTNPVVYLKIKFESTQMQQKKKNNSSVKKNVYN